MFEKPENARITKDEAERYGREINARSAKFENVEVEESEMVTPPNQIPNPLTEEEIKRRVGEQNYKNSEEGGAMNSINS
ncbi:hypothetical protein [Sporosarcina sp. FA9]|uniref:hypothetical protein n=1 Tax=Sporosarcina sp. FA9 TaxID=3413030 RepID=UPI003F655928